MGGGSWAGLIFRDNQVGNLFLVVTAATEEIILLMKVLSSFPFLHIHFFKLLIFQEDKTI